MENQIIQKAETYIKQLFDQQLSKDYQFHDKAHTSSVRKFSKLLGEQQNLSDSDLEILDLAALFHDAGYTKIYTGHEAISIDIATGFLSQENYPPEKIALIRHCIESTKTGVTPVSNLQKVLKDADLNNLGQETFYDLSVKLRHEWDVLCNQQYTDLEWLENNFQFLKNHVYYTPEAQALWKSGKKSNLKKMKTLIKMAKEKIAKQKSPIESRKSTQMMFKTALRNHIDLTGIADNKANMMLSINALIITIAMPLLASNAESIRANKFLLIPAALLLLTCILSVIFATLATRPIKMLGSIDADSLKKGDSNVFFFGNFYEMSLKQYRSAVDVVVNNEEIIEKSIVNDLYFLGRALGSKYSQLRTCYLIFMTGMTATVIAFSLSFLKVM